MARIVLYPAIALVAAQAAGAANTTTGWRQQPLNPEVFSSPFPVADQQYVALVPAQSAGPQNSGVIAWNSGSPEIATDSFVVGETALVPARIAGTGNTSVWRQQPVTPEAIAKPFPASEQQFTALIPLNNAPANAIVWNSGSPEVVIDGVVLEQGQVFPPVPKIISATPVQGWNARYTEVFKQPVIVRWQMFFNLPFQPYEGWVSDWPQMAKPFPAVDQQYVAQTLQPLVTTGPSTPARVWGAGFPEVTLDSFVVSDTSLVPTTTTSLSNTTTWQRAISPDILAAAFPVTAQQYVAHDLEPVPTFFKDGWRRYELDHQFARPFPANEQQFATTVYGRITTTFVDGWRGVQWEHRFARPFPANEQQYQAYGRGIVPTVPTPHGWEGIQLEARYLKPFPVDDQQFQAWPPEFVPVIISPPGAGKYPKIPSYIPQPPWDAKPQKPFRPVWDKPKTGAIEQQPAAPLPPAALFAPTPPPSDLLDPRAHPPAKLALPDFGHMAPSDASGFDQHMRDVQDRADVMAVLKSMGLIKDEG